jgi:putative FmdB family regulatory protein
MPNYTYKCKDCKHNSSYFLTLKQFDDMSEVQCKECNSNNTKRLFSPPSSKVKLSKEQVIENAKEEARDIARKINEGDQSLIRDIYGDK